MRVVTGAPILGISQLLSNGDWQKSTEAGTSPREKTTARSVGNFVSRTAYYPHPRVSITTAMSNYDDHRAGKSNGRLCVVCGGAVRNINQKANTCSPICTIARDNHITRERAMRLFPDTAEKEVSALNYLSKRRSRL